MGCKGKECFEFNVLVALKELVKNSNDKDIELQLVKDSDDVIWLECRSFDINNNTQNIKYYLPGSTTEGSPSLPITYSLVTTNSTPTIEYPLITTLNLATYNYSLNNIKSVSFMFEGEGGYVDSVSVDSGYTLTLNASEGAVLGGSIEITKPTVADPLYPNSPRVIIIKIE